ncbi:MAG TPA: aminotransferase class IV [Coriobacteriia bacterium]|nr:aminotransferase class IV [Coriobacteriia bacterium]
MKTTYVYLNGRIIPAEEAAISPFDIGLLRGYAVFDLLRTVNGKPFLLAEHLQRLRASADHLGLKVPATDEEISSAIVELLERNGHEEATVRLVLTGGPSPEGMTFNSETPTFFILTHDFHEPPASVYDGGVKLLMHEHRREVPKAKTTNYLTMLQHRQAAAEAGAFDLLYHDAGQVLEAATASFYVVRGDEIYAPDEDVLWGTIGTLVLDLARDRYGVIFGGITLEQVLGADEAFLTSTTRGVVPVVQLDDHRIGDGHVGPVTKELMERFRHTLLGD